jgi:hypothetical protein
MFSFRFAILIGPLIGILPANAQFGKAREFPVGQVKRIEDLPASRLRGDLEKLPAIAREKAKERLQGFHFTEADLPSMHVDREGGICYACEFSKAHAVETVPTPAATDPEVAAAAVPVSPFPTSLIFHSRPGAPNVLYINFVGKTITGTQWNNEIDRTSINAVAFSTDTDLTTFSDAEQTVIRRVWQRMAEDFAPFNIDVTTERPAAFNARTAEVLITRKTDSGGALNPFSTAGGVAYVDVFGLSNFGTYRPAFVYHDNLGNSESNIAEAASHEIGHNLGLSHDGTNTLEYYGGHGTDAVSWGPLMGTGYNRNVSQWSKGEYFRANNTQDDLATIAAKLSYRTDDHGATSGAATSLVITGGTTINSTTPETDPANASPANKGVITSSTDVDVFSFTTGSGAVQLNVNPWIITTGTRGGNLDIKLELYNQAGTLVTSVNPAGQTQASIQTTLAGGRYFLHVKNSLQGTPLANPPSGYTDYGSIGQYFISGTVIDATGVVFPPMAEVQVSNITTTQNATHTFTVTYSDNVAISGGSIDSNDIAVTGPGSYNQFAQLVSVNTPGNGTPRTATYRITPPSGTAWSSTHSGTYTIAMRASQVVDTEGAFVPAGTLGQFQVVLPTSIYFNGIANSTGWTLDSGWAFGIPNLNALSGPTSGFTGTQVIGYNLSGNYAKNLTTKYAISPNISVSGASSLALRFRRWLRIKALDTANIEVSTNGTTWTSIWTNNTGIADSGWQDVQYEIPALAAGSTSLKVRWGITSNNDDLVDIGWNIDDIEILAGAFTDSAPPATTLNMAAVTQGGAPRHSCSVLYTDTTAVNIATIDATDLVVTGPGSFSTNVTFVGTNTSTNGSPVTGIYSIPAPGGSWDNGDNGTYTVNLRQAAVSDTSGNLTPFRSLGNFSVSVPAPTPGLLQVEPGTIFTASGPPGGMLTPSSMAYTVTNIGQTSMNWAVAATVPWVDLSASSGTLTPGAVTVVTVSFNSVAAALEGGSYSGSVHFTNVSNSGGDTSRSISLNLISPGVLNISPPGDAAVSGSVGGPFIPQTLSYTVSNSGATSLSWTVGASVPWLQLNSSGGTLVPGASAQVTATFSSAVNAFTGGTYTGTLSFTNTTNGLGNDSRNINLAVLSPAKLSVTSSASLSASGPPGGPFVPASAIYTVGNTGDTVLSWSATATAPWISVSSGSGFVAPGDTQQVTVSFGGSAANLPAGTHSGSVNFINTETTADNTSRAVSLLVGAPLRFSSAVKTPGGIFQMTLQGVPGSSVVLEATDNFAIWTPIANGEIGVSGSVTLSDPDSITIPTRFYRARQGP